MDCVDRHPVRSNTMSTNTIDTGRTTTPEAGAPQPKSTRKPAKKSKAAKKAASKPKAERAKKKAEVIALMERAKGATLAEIMAATGWQAHTVRGFVSILGSKGGEKIESSKTDAGERTYPSRSSFPPSCPNATSWFYPGAALLVNLAALPNK
jgi:hypothetical protein